MFRGVGGASSHGGVSEVLIPLDLASSEGPSTPPPGFFQLDLCRSFLLQHRYDILMRSSLGKIGM